MDTLLAVFGEPYVVLVARTNVASDPNLRVSLKQNVDYLLSQPLLKTFSFETPAEAMQRLTPDSNFCGLRTPKKVTNATENEIVSLLRRLVLAHIANNQQTNLKIREQQQQINSLLALGAERQSGLDSLTTELADQHEKVLVLVEQVTERQDAVDSLGRQLAEEHEKAMWLLDNIAERQGAVESLATQLAERHERVLELVEHVGERQRAVDSIAAELDTNHKKVVTLTDRVAEREAELEKMRSTLGWRLLRQYGKVKYRYLLPIYRLLNLNRRAKDESP